MRPRRRALKIAGLVAGALGLLEIALQVYYRLSVGQWLFSRTSLPLYAPHAHASFWNKANLEVAHNSPEFQTTILTNSQGLRVAPGRGDYRLGKQLDVDRVLLLGASFAFGWGVDYEQSLAARLEALLRGSRPAGARPTEVINAGVPALDPAGGLGWLRSAGARLAPRVVIQLIHGTVAVSPEPQWKDITITEDGYLVRRQVRVRDRLAARAKSLATVFYSWWAYTKLKTWLGGSTEPRSVEGAGRELTLRRAFSPTGQEVLDAMGYYRDLRSAVEASGARLLIVFVPLGYCIHPEDAPRWPGLDRAAIEAQRRYDAAFCDHLTREGFECLNLTPDLLEAARLGQRLYYYVDIHWTPAGNQAAAQTVFERLRRPD